MNELVMMIGGIVLLCTGIVWAAFIVDEKSCKARWDLSGIEYRWDMWSGCQVKPENFWIPEKNYRVLD
jgi:hypothetical protein